MRILRCQSLGFQVRRYYHPEQLIRSDLLTTLPTAKLNNMLVSRITETGGNLKMEELLKLKKNLLNRKSDQMTDMHEPVNTALNHLSGTHLSNLLSSMEKPLMKSWELQSFLIMEMNELAKSDKDCFIRCLRILKDNSSLIRKTLGYRLTKLRQGSSTEKYTRLLIDLSLLYNNSLLAAYVLLSNDINIYKKETIKNVLRSLMLKNPILEEYQLSMIIKVSKKLNYKFDEFETTQILSKLENVQDVSILKKFQAYLLHNTVFPTQRAKIGHYYKLIQSDSILKNIDGCYLNWKHISNSYDNIEKHDTRIIALLIKTFTKSDKYYVIANEIIEKLPISYFSNPLISDEILNFGFKSKNIQLINKVINESKNTTRPMLTNLLKINMYYGDMNGVQSMIKEIIARSGHLSSLDNEIVVKGFLKNGEHQKALELLVSLPRNTANSSYLTYIDMMVNCSTKLVEKQLLIIDKFVETMKPDLTNSFWELLGSLFFKFVSKNAKTPEDLFLLRNIYYNSYKNFLSLGYMNEPYAKDQIFSKEITYNPFRVPINERKTITIKITDKTKVVLVYTIMDKAIKLRSGTLLDWSCRELLDLGLSVSDIKVNVTKKMNTKFKNIGIDERKSIQQFKTDWESNTLGFMKDRKAYKVSKKL